MTDLRQAAQQALEAMMMMRDKYEEYACPEYACPACDHADAAITALRKALAEPEQEPLSLNNGRLTQYSDGSIGVGTPTPQREHITDGSPCWCNPDVIEEEGGNVIVHNYEDNWQQYAKPGETAQQCIERHRAEQDALMKLYATPRKTDLEALNAELVEALRHCMKVMQDEADAYLAWNSDTNATLLAEIEALKEYLNDKG